MNRPAILNINGCISSILCFASTEKATIVLKSHLISFWIHKYLKITNIIFDGSDLYPYYLSDKTTKESEYRYKKVKCCICDVKGSCKQDTSLKSGYCACGLENQQITIPFNSEGNMKYNDRDS